MTTTFGALADLFDPTPVDVYAVLDYQPTPRQTVFHDAHEWDVLYGGAAGGGKTRALLMEGIRACVTYPGIVVLAIRESYPQLAESFIAELSRVAYATALGATYTKTDHNLTFANGSVIRFRFCDGLEDAKLRLGSEIQLLLVDEATQQAPAAIDFLCMRLRSSRKAIPVLGVRLASNPGGVGHGWAKARYVDATAHGASAYEDVVDKKPTGHMVRFVPARYTDNPHVPDYESVLDAIKDPALRAAYRDGSWDVFAGQFFTEWSRDRHIVPAFTVPPEWRRVAGLDWGWAAPHAVVWAAVDQDKRVWVYREQTDTKTTEGELARLILESEGALTDDGKLRRTPVERPTRVADPSMWGKTSDAHPVAVSMIGAGCLLIPAENDRISGWQRVHTYLADAAACAYHRGLGWETCPLLHVLDGAAPELCRTLPALVHDSKRVEDVDTDGDDHQSDALRYLLMFLPVPRHVREARVDPSTPEQKLSAMRAQRARRKRRHEYLGSL